MDYNNYECTPLFSYENNRTAIRDIKAEEMRQMRNHVPMTDEQRNVRLAAQLAVPAVLLISLLFFAIAI